MRSAHEEQKTEWTEKPGRSMTLPPGFLTESNKLDILFLLTAHAGSHLALAVAGHLTLLILDHFPNHFSADGSILSGCQVSVVSVG